MQKALSGNLTVETVGTEGNVASEWVSEEYFRLGVVKVSIWGGGSGGGDLVWAGDCWGRQGKVHVVQRGQRAATCGVGKLQTAQVLLR